MRTFIFTVERLEFVGGGKFLLGGRNCKDVLRRGDRLHVRNKSEALKDAEFCVDEILFYNHTVETVDPGHTAGLFFSNELACHVRLGDELYGQSDT
jgi:hypothetical protein